MTWTCAYESRLTVTTDEFVVDDEPIIDRLSGTGDLGVGFSLSIHDDLRSTAPISEKDLCRNYLDFLLNLTLSVWPLRSHKALKKIL